MLGIRFILKDKYKNLNKKLFRVERVLTEKQVYTLCEENNKQKRL